MQVMDVWYARKYWTSCKCVLGSLNNNSGLFMLVYIYMKIIYIY
jgi:hypothetical protein